MSCKVKMLIKDVYYIFDYLMKHRVVFIPTYKHAHILMGILEMENIHYEMRETETEIWIDLLQ